MKTAKNHLFRITSILLCFVMLFVFMTQSILAEAGELLGGNDTEAVPDEHKVEPAYVLGEMTDDRTPNTKTFRLSDGSFVLADYAEPVHFENQDGKWTDYDNTLKYIEDDEFVGYENTASDVLMRFAEAANDKGLVSLQSGKYAIGMLLKDAVLGGKTEITNTAEAPEGNDIDSATTLTKYSSGVKYEDILADTDIQYVLNGGNLKENIIVKERTGEYVYTFDLALEGLVAALAEDGSVLLNDDETGEAVFVIPAGYMYDANYECSDNVYYSIEEKDGVLTLTVIADAEWMEDEERAFPVTIDPSIYAGAYQTPQVSDTTAVENHPDDVNGSDEFLRVGSTSATKKNRTFVKLNTLPALPDASVIVDATLNLRQVKYQNNWLDYTGNCDSIKIAVREVTSSWAENTLTWNNQPTVSSTVIDYRTVTPADTAATSGAMYYFNITSLMQKWYNDSATNYGVAVYPINEQTTSSDDHAFTCFYSKNNPYANNQTIPFFTITYRSSAGLEDYYTYHTHCFDSVTGFINDYTGNLVVVQDLGLEIENFPLDLAYVFNDRFCSRTLTSGAGYGMNFGFGWHFSAVLVLKDLGVGSFVNGNTYELIDGDGASHYFTYSADEGCYVDEDGLGFKLTVPTGSIYLPRILDAGDGWKYEFTNGKLTNVSYFEDENAVTATYTFDYIYSNDNKLIRIEDGTNTVLTLTYNGTGLATATDAGGHTATIVGGASNIDSITTSYGTYSYTYNSGDDMTSMLEVSTGKEYRYTYTNNYKVTSVAEYYSNTRGDSVYISYANKRTTFMTAGVDDSFNVVYGNIYTIYCFDNYGRTVNVYNESMYTHELFSAIGVVYGNEELFPEAENNIRQIYRSDYGTHHMLLNPSAEEGADYWSTYNATATNNEAYIGNKSFKVEYSSGEAPLQGVGQAVTLNSGKQYVLSAYVKIQNVPSSYGAVLTIGNTYNNILGGTVLANSEYLCGTTETDIQNGWRRIVLEYTPSTTDTYYVFAGIRSGNDSSVAYFDCIQLEEFSTTYSSAVSEYNVIENAGFERAVYWAADHYPGALSRSSEARFGSYGATLEGDPDNERQIYQNIAGTFPAGTTFTIAGWGKADSVHISEDDTEGRTFEIRAEVIYQQSGLDNESATAEFNDCISDWQYASGSFVPSQNSPYTVVVYCSYNNNCNTAYFDNISFTLGGVVSFEDASSGEGGEGDDGELYDIDATHKYQEIDGIRYTYTYDSEERIIETVVENVSGSGSTDKFYTSTNYYTDPNNSDLEVTEEIDERGISTKYKYLNDKLHELIDGKGHTTSYTYNADDLLSKLSQTIGTLEISNNYTYNSNGDLTGIAHKEGTTTTQAYSFAYDVYGNLTSISQGNTALVTYAYNPNNGKLISATYANGFVEGYGYDAVDNLVSVKYNNVVKYKYKYDKNNVLQYQYDLVNGTTERYDYDVNGNHIRTVKYKSATFKVELITEYVYNSDGEFAGYRYIDGSGNASYYGYTYDDDGQISRVTLPSGASARYYYDKFGRITDYGIYNSSGNHVTSEWYTYLPGNGGSNASTHLIGTIDYADCTWFDYTYDNNGNILTISKNGSLVYSYEYDDLDQLIRENDHVNGTTYIFLYDYSGNIQSKHTLPYWAGCPTSHYMYLLGTSDDQPVYYTYGNSSWGDQLTAYDGITISYDASGNPLNWRNVESLSWTGRELTYLYNDSGMSGMYFRYNADGIRTYKSHYDHNTMDMYHVNYVLDGTKIISEYYTHEITNATYSINYYYDANDSVIGFNYNGTDYYYRQNLQGDIIAILNTSGTKVVEYTYNAWGEVLGVTGSLANTIGSINPFRYRGYYYDTETGFYYLQSRYYDPVVGRFLNADSVFDHGAEHLGYNLYTYCANNYVNRKDPTGYFTPANVVGAVIGLIGGSVIGTAIANYFNLGWPWRGLVIGSVSVVLTVVGWFAGPAVYAAVKPLVIKAIAACTVVFNRAQEWILKALGVSQTWINQALRLIDAKTVKFTQTVLNHLNNDRYMPVQTLIDAIKTGRAVQDPQGMANRVMYYCQVWINGKKYQLEVLVNWATKTIEHYLYKK